MKKILSVNKGKTHCDWCPFTGLVPSEHCKEYIKNILEIDCAKYNLATLKVCDIQKPKK